MKRQNIAAKPQSKRVRSGLLRGLAMFATAMVAMTGLVQASTPPADAANSVKQNYIDLGAPNPVRSVWLYSHFEMYSQFAKGVAWGIDEGGSNRDYKNTVVDMVSGKSLTMPGMGEDATIGKGQTFGGSGTGADPYFVQSSRPFLAPDNDLTLTVKQSVVLGQPYFRTDITLTNTGTSEREMQIGSYGQCQDPTYNGPGLKTMIAGDKGLVKCYNNNIETSFISLDDEATFTAGHFEAVRAVARQQLVGSPDANACWVTKTKKGDCAAYSGKQSMGLFWAKKITAGESLSHSYLSTMVDSLQFAHLVPSSSVSSSTVGVNEAVTFKLSLTNEGSDVASNNVMTFPVPSGMTVVGTSGPGSYSPSEGKWKVPSIAAGATVSLDLQMQSATAGRYTTRVTDVTTESIDQSPCAANGTCGSELVVTVESVTLENARSAGIEQLKAKAAEVTAAIGQQADVSQADKDKAVSDVASALATAIAAVNTTNTSAEVATEVARGKQAMDDIFAGLVRIAKANLAEAKDKAKGDLTAAADAAKAKIELLDELTRAEKDAAIQSINTELNKGTAAIDGASTAADVKKAVRTGEAAIDKIVDDATLVDAKRVGVKALNAKAVSVTTAVENVTNVSKAEKDKAIADVAAVLKDAEASVNGAKTLTGVSNAVQNGSDAMDDVYNSLVGAGSTHLVEAKAKANSDLRAVADNAKAEIDKLSELSAAEKKTAKDAIDAAAQKGVDGVQSATTAADVQSKVDAAVAEIDKVVVDATLVNAKRAGIKELQAKAASVTGAIAKLSNVSQGDKDQAVKDVAAELALATQSVNEGKSVAVISGAVKDGKRAMDDIYYALMGVDDGVLNDSRDQAKKDLDSKGDTAKEEIEKLPELSKSEKDAAKDAIDDAVKNGKDAIDAADTAGDVRDEVAGAESEVDKIVDAAVLLDAQRAGVKELEAKAASVTAAIAKQADVSQVDRDRAVADVAAALNTATAAVNASKTVGEVSTEVQKGKAAMDAILSGLNNVSAGNLADAKDKAKADLVDAADTAKTKVESLEELTRAEKDAAIKQIESELAKGLQAVEGATTTDQVKKEVTQAEAAIEKVVDGAELVNAKRVGLKELEAKAVSVTAAIDRLSNVSKAHKDQAVVDLQTELDRAKVSLDGAKTLAAAANAVQNGKGAMDDVYNALVNVDSGLLASAKDKAAKDLGAAAEKAKGEIDALDELSAAEKQTAKDAIDSAVQNGLDAISSAGTSGDVQKEVGKAEAAIGKVVDDATLVNAKRAGVKELQRKALSVTGSIAKLSNVSQDQKDQAALDVQAELEKATMSVNSGKNVVVVSDAVKDGKRAIDDVYYALVGASEQNLANAKDQAKTELDSNGEAAKDEIEKLPELSKSEKDAAKDAIDDAVKNGKDAIDAADTVEDVRDVAAGADSEVGNVVDAAVLLDAKRAGVKELEAKAASVTAAIKKQTDVSKADRDRAVADVAAALKSATASVNASKTVGEVSAAVKNGKAAMDAILSRLVKVSVSAPAAPKVDPSDGTKVSGTAALGTKVKVKNVKGEVICTTTADSSTGTFSCKLNPVVSNGVKLSVTATNAKGLESKATVITVVRGKGTTPPKGTDPKDVERAKLLKQCAVSRKVPVFADTPLSHKFYKEIDWMECMKFSTGWRQSVGKPLYKPADNLQRQAMAAFIYRMEAPKGYKAPAVSPFADVKPTDSFYKEMAWMYEMKYSTGWAEPSGKPTYRPLEPLSREAMAAFIYRLEASKDAKVKSYEAPKVSMLADMKPGAKFYKEISWMYDSKLSTGNKVGNTKEYWPKADLSRQAMAAFIYRLETGALK